MSSECDVMASVARVDVGSIMRRPASVGGDDGADVLAVERAGQVARLQPVDDLNRAPVLGVLHHLEHAALDDDVVQVQRLQLLDA